MERNNSVQNVSEEEKRSILIPQNVKVFLQEFQPLEIEKKNLKIEEQNNIRSPGKQPLTQSPIKTSQELKEKQNSELLHSISKQEIKSAADPNSQKSTGKQEPESKIKEIAQSEKRQDQDDNVHVEKQQSDSKSDSSSGSGESFSSISSSGQKSKINLMKQLELVKKLIEKKKSKLKDEEEILKAAYIEKKRQKKQKYKEQQAVEKEERIKKNQQKQLLKQQEKDWERKRPGNRKAKFKFKKQLLPIKKQKPKPEIEKREKAPKNTEPSNYQSAPAADEELDFTNKLHCVDEFAKRWWYALPAWPPSDFDCKAALKQHQFRLIQVSEFKAAPEIEGGFRKVFGNEYYEGVYTDSEGKVYDLRPRESMPSLANFKKMDINKLRKLLKTAYEKQKEAIMKARAENKQYDKATEEQIEHSLAKKISKVTRYM